MANSTARPCWASSRIALQNERRPSTSIPVVGSSSSSSAGSDSSAIANRSRCCSPPEHLATLRPAISVMPALSSTASTGLVSANRLAVYCTVSRTVRSLSRPPVCITAATRPRAMAWRGAMPEHLDLAGRRVGEPQHHVDGGGLAGAVGAEEGHHLAGLDLEVDPPDRVHVAEVLGDPAQAHRGSACRVHALQPRCTGGAARHGSAVTSCP